jgi:chromosome segregation ATPase
MANMSAYHPRFSDEFNKLLDRVSNIEARMLVFETRSESWEKRLLDLHYELNRVGGEMREAQSDMRSSMNALHAMIQSHTEAAAAARIESTEAAAKERVQVLWAVMVAALGAAGTFVMWLISTFWDKVQP